MLHTALENIDEWLSKIWHKSNWLHVAKWVVNGIYASVFFGWIFWYFFDEVGIIAGILIGGLVWIATAKEFAIGLIELTKKKR